MCKGAERSVIKLRRSFQQEGSDCRSKEDRRTEGQSMEEGLRACTVGGKEWSLVLLPCIVSSQWRKLGGGGEAGGGGRVLGRAGEV